MDDSPRYSDSKVDTGDDSGVGPDRRSTTSAPRYPGTPRWVKVSGIVVLVLILLVVIVMFAGGGQHGPGRHMPSGTPGGLASPVAQGVQQP
jgi:hypothetical protein